MRTGKLLGDVVACWLDSSWPFVWYSLSDKCPICRVILLSAYSLSARADPQAGLLTLHVYLYSPLSSPPHSTVIFFFFSPTRRALLSLGEYTTVWKELPPRARLDQSPSVAWASQIPLTGGLRDSLLQSRTRLDPYGMLICAAIKCTLEHGM